MVDDGQFDTLILGIGNVLWADEGFGVRCVEAMNAAYVFPDNVRVMDGGTQGLYLLPYVEAARRLIIFDAVDYGLEPGTLKLVENAEVPKFMGAKKMSLHQTGFQEVLACAALADHLPEAMVLIGVQPEELEDYGGSLRPRIKARIPEVLEIAVERLVGWGIPVAARGTGETMRAESGILDIQRYEMERPTEEQACRLGDIRFLATGV